MKRYMFLFAMMAVLVSCEEFGPVVTGEYPDPKPYEYYTDDDFDPDSFITIAELKAMYEPGHPFVIEDDIVIKESCFRVAAFYTEQGGPLK